VSVVPSPTRSHRTGLATTAVVDVVAGVPVYFVAFLFSYGFRDVVGVANHLAFLTMVCAFAVVAGLVGAAADAAATSRRLAASLAVVVPASLSLNCAVVAAGSVVSALNKDAGSVSAAFSPLTDVLVATGLGALSVGLALAAVRAARR